MDVHAGRSGFIRHIWRFHKVAIILLIFSVGLLAWFYGYKLESLRWLRATKKSNSPYLDKVYGQQLNARRNCDNNAGLSKKLVWILYENFSFPNDTNKINFRDCACSNCELLESVVLSDKVSEYSVDDADVVMFDNAVLTHIRRPPVRRDGQLFVYVGRDPLMFSDEYMEKQWDTAQFTNVFNWTFSYRTDADVYVPFGAIFRSRPHPPKTTNEYRTLFRKKTKNIAVVLSRKECSGQIPFFVSELRKYAMTDTYLENQHRNCDSGIVVVCDKKDVECGQPISDLYKFYLSFEYLDADYITGNTFNWFSKDIIQVVNGVVNYTDILPHGTFIDAQQFDSPKQLAAFLAKLGADENRYVKYLQRKSLYSVRSGAEVRQEAYCTLCSMINNAQEYQKMYPHIGRWCKKR